MTKPKNPKYPKQLGEPIRWMPAGPPPDAELDVLGEAREEWERKSAEASAKLEAEKLSKIRLLAEYYGVSEDDHWSLLLRVCEDKFRGFKISERKLKVKGRPKVRENTRLMLDVASIQRDTKLTDKQALEILITQPRYAPKGRRRNGDVEQGTYKSLQSRLNEARKAEPMVRALIEANAWVPWLDAMQARYATEKR